MFVCVCPAFLSEGGAVVLQREKRAKKSSDANVSLRIARVAPWSLEVSPAHSFASQRHHSNTHSTVTFIYFLPKGNAPSDIPPCDFQTSWCYFITSRWMLVFLPYVDIVLISVDSWLPSSMSKPKFVPFPLCSHLCVYPPPLSFFVVLSLEHCQVYLAFIFDMQLAGVCVWSRGRTPAAVWLLHWHHFTSFFISMATIMAVYH